MKIAFNPSTVAALTTPPNNKDITFDLRGHNIFARGVKFYGTDTNTWRDIKVNNVSIGSHTLDLRNGSNTTLTNTNGVVTINSTWRPVVDSLTSDSTTSSLSAKQGKVLKSLIDGKSNSDHNHDGRYLRLSGLDTMQGNLYLHSYGTSYIGRGSGDKSGADFTEANIVIRSWWGISFKSYDDIVRTYINTRTGNIGTKGVLNAVGAVILGRVYNGGDDEGIIIKPASNGYAGLILGTHSGERSVFYLTKGNPFWRYNNGSTNLDILHPKKPGVIALTSDIPDKNSWNYDDRYYTKAESDIKYITDITTSVNKLTFTKNGANIIRDITVNVVHSLGNLTNISNKDNTTKASSGLYIYNSYNLVIGTNSYSSVLSINTGGTIQIAGDWGDDYARNLYWRSLSDKAVSSYPWKSWRTILDSENYSSTLDSRYYTESEVNSLLSRKLDRVNLTTGSWNPRGYHLAADYHYNGGDLSISENNGKMYVSVDGCFWLNEGQYRVLDTSDISYIRDSVTLHQYLGATDVAWYPLVWGGASHNNTSDSTGAVYKSHDKLSWLTSSLTLYATNIQTNNIKNLSIGGGIYWNSLVESTSDSTDAASITLVKSGVAGGTTLVLSLMNDTNDTILFKTNTAARLYHNNYPILTTLNTYVSNNKGYINGSEITLVNNSDTVDGVHANQLCRIYTFKVHNTIIKVGTLTSGQYGHVCKLRFNSGIGYNAGNQDKAMTVVIRASNGNANSKGFYFEAHSESYRAGAFTTFYLHQTSKNQCELYMAAFNYSGQSTYEISFSDGDLWTNEISVQSALPTSNIFTLPNYQIAYNDYNVASATKLQTPRSIWGQSFDGTGNVSGSLSGVGHIQFSADNSYSIGTTTSEAAHTYTRQVWARHLNASRVYTGDTNLYIGYSNTAQVKFYSGTQQSGNGSNERMTILTNGNIGIGTTSPIEKLDVNGLMRAGGFHHSSVNSDNYILLAGGGYKSFGGDDSNPIFLGYLNLDHGNDGTVSSSFSCLGYSVPFTYTRGGNYCRISIPNTTHQVFYIKAATASVNYSGGGMDTWVGDHRGTGAWWLHCYASGANEVRVKGFRQANSNNDSWWGGNPLYSGNDGANKITVCIFGYVKFR